MTTVMSRDKMNSLASLIGDTKSFVSQADIDRMRDIARPEAEREAERVAAIKAAKASTLAKADARRYDRVLCELKQRKRPPQAPERPRAPAAWPKRIRAGRAVRAEPSSSGARAFTSDL